MQPLVIFGAGGLGRELLGWINASSEAFRTQWRVTAFVADDAVPGMMCAGLPVCHRTDFAEPPRYLLAIGSPADRRRLSIELAALGWEAPIWIHESVLVSQRVEIGEGSLIFPLVSLSSDTKIGRFVLVNPNCGISHDCEIGDFSALLGGAGVGGNVRIGSGVTMGTNAIIHPDKSVGDDAVVGIGSVVIRSVKPGITVFGNPAKQIRVSRR